MTPQETNAAVSEALGLFLFKFDHLGYGHLREFKQGIPVFDPATDPAAAEWALGQSLPEDTWVHIEWYSRRKGGEVVYRLTIDGKTTEGTFCEVVCEMILAAAGKLEPEETGVAE